MAAAATAAATLTHRHVFGLKGDVKDDVHYVDENLVVYPSGHNTVLYNTESKTQRFFPGTEGTEGITALAVSPSKRYLAVAERGERALVTVYDLVTMKKRKMLQTTECQSKEFVSVCFSQENKFLLTLGGAPDWTLVYWAWDKVKPTAHVKVSNAQGAPIYQCSFNPMDSTLVCVVGNGIFKYFRVQEGQFKQIPSQMNKREPQNYLCHTWLSDDRLIVGTDSGDLLLFDNGGEFRMVLQSSPSDGSAIDSLVSYSKGFLCGGDDGVLHLYERSEDPREVYKWTKTFKIDGQQGSKIKNMAVSPSEDYLCSTLDSNQIYVLGLSNTDIMKAEEMQFEYLSTPFHSQAVTGLDVCIRKPLVITCGLDKQVIVWNYLDKSVELQKTFNEEAYSVAFHPSGFHVLVGFSDKLRLMNLLMDDIRQFKEFPIKACREVRFSNGGQLFAAVNGNTIQIFSTYTCENVTNLRGHNGKVRSLYWTQDDTGLVSAGMDGAVYEWKLKDTKRENEFVQKGCNFSGVLCTNENKIFAVGSDHMLKEIGDSQVTRELDAGTTLGQIVLSHSQRMLFAGTAEPDKPGSIRCYKFPLTGDFVEYQCHSNAVTRIRISHDDNYLFTTAEDSCLYIFDVREKEGRVAVRKEKDGALPFAEEILVTRSDLEEKNQMTQELKNKVEELNTHKDYQLRMQEMQYKDKINELTEKFTQELEQDKNKYELLREEKNDMEMEFEDRIKQMEEQQHQQLQELEAMHQQKLMAEVERFQALSQEKDMMNRKWEETHQMLVEQHERYVQELREDYEAQLEEEQMLRERVIEEKEDLTRIFEETRRQLEEDADREIEELKEKYDQKLNAEREANLRLKGENGIMKKKFTQLLKDIDDRKEEIKTMVDKEKELYDQIAALEKDIQGQKKEIAERDETIGDKEKRIYELKKKNQELEKFKFVLDYKIKELKRQIGPRETEIQDMKEQIKEMDKELEHYHRSNAQLDLMLQDLKLKLKGMQDEIVTQRKKLSDSTFQIKRYRDDLHESVQLIQDPKALKECVLRLYRKHVQEESKAPQMDQDTQKEYNRQRDYLERSVESLKRKLAKDSEVHRQDNMRIMQENVALIKEINDLRREIKTIKQQQRQAELNGQGNSSPNLALSRRSGSIPSTPGSAPRIAPPQQKSPRSAPHVYENGEAKREIEMQRGEISNLRRRIEELENSAVLTPRPASRDKLIPLPAAPTGLGAAGIAIPQDEPQHIHEADLDSLVVEDEQGSMPTETDTEMHTSLAHGGPEEQEEADEADASAGNEGDTGLEDTENDIN
eukprot:GILJ01003213.1.p1 GENE.GILJ01003213.1~~GILJ01003213.1.p1  ORF type:complete len:1307 (+),score=279.75 GILJ01003213.1:41-3922(+)